MTLNEFKAWLEGFEEAMGGNPPTAEKWATIKAKLEKVTIAAPLPSTPYEDPYRRRYPIQTLLNGLPAR